METPHPSHGGRSCRRGLGRLTLGRMYAITACSLTHGWSPRAVGPHRWQINSHIFRALTPSWQPAASPRSAAHPAQSRVTVTDSLDLQVRISGFPTSLAKGGPYFRLSVDRIDGSLTAVPAADYQLGVGIGQQPQVDQNGDLIFTSVRENRADRGDISYYNSVFFAPRRGLNQRAQTFTGPSRRLLLASLPETLEPSPMPREQPICSRGDSRSTTLRGATWSCRSRNVSISGLSSSGS